MLRYKALAATLPLTFVLAGCPLDDEVRAKQYQVTITNQTAGQPLSPATLLVHTADWQPFTLGEPASEGLEHIAEAGDNSVLLDAVKKDRAVLTAMSDEGGIPPGGRTEVTFKVRGGVFETSYFTWLAMAGNTNDAFGAVPALSLQGMAVGETRSVQALSYDAGTEANTESPDTVPGPASTGLGEGFNATRDDVRDAVYIHSGVVTADDGLATSTLGNAQRWDHPIARVAIERVK
ncbi:spondin domain-containing protein [Marinobacteraceae bacterium S3BR75-40.1]